MNNDRVWYVNESGSSITVRGRGGVVARMAISTNSSRAPEGRANAHLLALSPQMLMALEWAIAELDEVTHYDRPEQRDAALERAKEILGRAQDYLAGRVV